MTFLEKVIVNPAISFEKGKVYPFVEMANVGIHKRAPDLIENKAFSSGVRFEDGDTVVARITPCLQNGKGFYCKDINQGFGSTEFLVFRPKDDTVNNLYLYYYMQTTDVREKMIKSMVGSTGRQRVNNDVFKSMPVAFPSVNVQKQIGEALSAFDDLIENNQQQIKLLEEAAQRLFREWFVELRYPGYDQTRIVDGVPEGWQNCTLADVIAFDPKVSLSKERIKQSVPMSALSTTSMVLDESQFTVTTSNAGSKFQNGDTLLARITPCLENGKTAFVWNISSEEGAVGSTEYIVMRSKKLNPYMVYLLARTDDFRREAINSMSGSDGRQRAKVDKLSILPYKLPTQEVIDQFGAIAAPMFEEIYGLNAQNHKLAEARDRLLPKLMSGEIEV